MDAEELLLKINSGKTLKVGEIEEVASLLEWLHQDQSLGEKLSVDDIYAMLLVLGRSGRKEYRALLEKSLDAKDPMTVSLVVETLCLNWGETEAYLERIISFALGAPWDEDRDVQTVAIKVIGEFLATVSTKKQLSSEHLSRQRELLTLLIGLVEDESEEDWVRQGAYYALCRAAGLDWENIPSDYASLNLNPDSTDINWEMINSLRSQAKG